MKRILITGVTGFVGASLVTRLQAEENIKLFGHSRNAPAARDRFKNDHITIVESILSTDIDTQKIDCIIHLAGIAHDLSSQYKEQDYEEVNYECTKRIFDNFRKSTATKFIFLSSIKAAVDVSSIPATEDMPCQPATPYGRSKRKAEQYLLSSELPPGKSVYILRPCMIHGAGNKGNLNLLYKFVRSGLPFPLGKFHNQRSFLNIDNFNFIISNLIRQPIPSGIYHLADDNYLSTTELYTVIAHALNKKAWIIKLPRGIMTGLAQLVGRRKMLDKLTEDMMVSNKKIVDTLGQALPVDIRLGIRKTISSFN